MAISVDAISLNAQTSGSTLTFAHTVASGAVLYVAAEGNGAGSITSVTYNGTALTEVSTEGTSADSGHSISWWKIDNPDSGTHNIVVSTSVSAGDTSGLGISLLGANTSGSNGAEGAAVSDGSVAVTLSKTITTTADNSVVLAAFATNQATFGTHSCSGTNQTLQEQQGNPPYTRTSISTQTTTTAGSYTNTFTLSGSSGANLSMSVVEVKVGTDTSTVTHNLNLLGVGT